MHQGKGSTVAGYRRLGSESFNAGLNTSITTKSNCAIDVRLDSFPGEIKGWRYFAINAMCLVPSVQTTKTFDKVEEGI